MIQNKTNIVDICAGLFVGEPFQTGEPFDEPLIFDSSSFSPIALTRGSPNVALFG